jgi:hypothetical protein
MLDRHAEWARWEVEEYYAAVRVVKLLYIDAEAQPIEQLVLHDLYVGECPAADDFAGERVGNPQNELAAALVGQRYAVAHQLLAVELVARLFEL